MVFISFGPCFILPVLFFEQRRFELHDFLYIHDKQKKLLKRKSVLFIQAYKIIQIFKISFKTFQIYLSYVD